VNAVADPLDAQVAALRRFNRFYTRHVELLGERLLDSPYSLAEARVLYELARRDSPTASDIARDLGLDAGYLSRILRRFEKAELIARVPSERDGRRSHLALTEAGRAAFEPLDAASRRQGASLLASLPDADRKRLVAAMARIESLLGQRDATIILRPHQPGDMGWIVHRHAVLYAREYGWDETFEALVAEIVAAFLRGYDPKRERCIVAEKDGGVVGSVFLVRDTDETAKLRLLYVEPDARGARLGRRLVAECIRTARALRYRRLTLWTNDVLHAARRIYQEAGFVLVREEKHRSFGHDLVGQYWELAL
jgi:DNA-binding MarR family transcriptional regulator/GNAT superfamily N-acetyltransferase